MLIKKPAIAGLVYLVLGISNAFIASYLTLSNRALASGVSTALNQTFVDRCCSHPIVPNAHTHVASRPPENVAKNVA